MKRLIVTCLVALSTVMPAHAWGKTGHRVVGAVAQTYLSQTADTGVKDILGPEGIAEAADWPDHMRSNPAPFWRSEANPWHYVTIPVGQTYAQVTPPPEGDAITALAKYRAIAIDPAAPLEERQLALRFIIHIVGDLHQPLHVGNGTDRGGNQFVCTFFEEMTNLHAVWDELLINYQELSYTEWTTWLVQKITPDQLAEWAKARPADWADESATIRDTIYPDTQILSYDYAYEARDTIRARLSMGGVRLAAYLNEMFETVSPDDQAAE